MFGRVELLSTCLRTMKTNKGREANSCNPDTKAVLQQQKKERKRKTTKPTLKVTTRTKRTIQMYCLCSAFIYIYSLPPFVLFITIEYGFYDIVVQVPRRFSWQLYLYFFSFSLCMWVCVCV